MANLSSTELYQRVWSLKKKARFHELCAPEGICKCGAVKQAYKEILIVWEHFNFVSTELKKLNVMLFDIALLCVLGPATLVPFSSKTAPQHDATPMFYNWDSILQINSITLFPPCNGQTTLFDITGDHSSKNLLLALMVFSRWFFLAQQPFILWQHRALLMADVKSLLPDASKLFSI